jgi:hypothetical protein
LAGYGQRAQTRTDHLREIVRYLGWRVVGVPEWKELDEFLFARAMEHDSAKLLFMLACEFLVSERVVRPGVVPLLEHVATARERARREGIVNLLNVELAEYARGCGLGRAGLSWGGQAAAGVTPVISFQVVNRSVISRR